MKEALTEDIVKSCTTHYLWSEGYQCYFKLDRNDLIQVVMGRIIKNYSVEGRDNNILYIEGDNQ